MPRPTGLRERKKLEQRQRIADVAASLFASQGYDAVSISDVASAADVSHQTIYNYFPAKQDLGLDRAEVFRQRFSQAVKERAAGTSPAAALQPFVHEDVSRFRGCEPEIARGEHPALCVGSVTFRGFALLARERDVEAITAAILESSPGVHGWSARAHAAALVAVLQAVTDQVGTSVLTGRVSESDAAILERDAMSALDDLDRQFVTFTRLTTS